MRVDIPGFKTLDINHLAVDYNGTIAVDGALIPAVRERIEELSTQLDVHVLTADTFGTVRDQCAELDVSVDVLDNDHAALDKVSIVKSLGAGTCCIGNGFNDRLMFEQAELAIGVMEREGMCMALLVCADIVVAHAEDAFDLLLKPGRLKATLRG